MNYNVGIQTPQYRIDSLDALLRTPISPKTGIAGNMLTGFDGRSRGFIPGVWKSGRDQREHSTAFQPRHSSPRVCAGDRQPLQCMAGLRWCMPMSTGATWEESERNVEKIMHEEAGRLPRGTTFALRGQIETMRSSFFRLGPRNDFRRCAGLSLDDRELSASWLDPFIILTALPGAMAGNLWMLFLTATTLSVPSLMGAIMCIGVATA